jgi:hypothetical protein
MKIRLHYVHDITYMEPKERTKDTHGKHTVMKSNAQLHFEDQRETKSTPLASPIQADPVATSSSTQIAPPAYDAMLSHILDTVLSI